MENADLFAWMIGRYSLWDPKKYPNKPNTIQRKIPLPDEPEDEELMKDKLTMFANIHNTIEGAR